MYEAAKLFQISIGDGDYRFHYAAPDRDSALAAWQREYGEIEPDDGPAVVTELPGPEACGTCTVQTAVDNGAREVAMPLWDLFLRDRESMAPGAVVAVSWPLDLL